MLAPTTKIISSLSIKASQITVPCHNSQTIMTAPTSFAITSSFLGSHRVPTPLTLKRPVMAALTSLKIGVATHSAGRDFFSAEPPHPFALALARATRRPHDGTAHCRRHHAVSPTPASLPRPRRCSALAGFAASALAPSALPLFALTTSCRSPRCRPSLRNAAAALLAYKRSKAVTSPVTSPSTPSRFAPPAEPLLPSPAHSRDEAPTIDPLPRAVPRQGEMAGSSPDH